VYNFLIVDDEYWIRLAIAAKIKASDFPYIDIYFADNGYDALDLVAAHDIDIMLIDIRMPGMDGLTLIKKAKELKSHIHFFVITGYADFNYAQDALQSGVEAYLLKPIDDDQFLLALNQLRERMDSNARKLSHVKEIERSNQALATEKDLNLLFHAMHHKVVQDDFKRIDRLLQRGNGFFQLMMIRIDHRVVDDESKFMSIKSQIRRLIVEQTRGCEDCIVVDDYRRLNNVLTVIRDSSQERIASAAREILRTLVELNQEMKVIFVGLSTIHDKLSRSIYSEALWACDQRLLYQDRCFFVYNADVEKKAFPKDYYDDFKNLLETKELQLFEARIRVMLNPNRVKTVMHGNIREVVHGLLLLIFQENDVPDSIQRSSTDECIENSSHMEDIILAINNFLESVLIKDLVISENCKEIIEKVKKYILIHYKQKLVLKELAAMYNMNSNYMSSIFKEVCGKGFSDYLTDVRLEHACSMLMTTKMSINEIAQEVGFDNSSYFYRVFKNTFGVTPLKYRNHMEMKQLNSSAALGSQAVRAET